MKKIFLLFLAGWFATAASAQYNDADAVFGKITKTFTLNDDGSTTMRCYKQLRLQSHLSFNQLYGETFIIYDPTFQEITINEAYTIMADGKRVVTPENAFNEVLPHGAAHSAAFNHLRELVVTHTATEIGATIYLDYTLASQNDFLPALMGNELVQESSPIEEMQIVIKVPSAVELQHRMMNLRTAPEMVVQGNQKVYTWTFKGIAAGSQDYFSGAQLSVPRLVFTTSPKAGAAVDWITRQQAFDYHATDILQKYAATIKSEKQEEMKTLLALQNMVAKEMAYDRVPPEWNGYRVRTPEEVWQSNGGNQLEKAVLLATLLNAADFHAVAVMAAPEKLFEKNMGDLLIFDESFVKVNTKNFGTLYLSATSTNDQSLDYGSGGQVLMPLYKNADISPTTLSEGKNVIDAEGKFVLAHDQSLSGQMTIRLQGKPNPFLLLQNDANKIKSQFTQNMISKSDDAVKVANSNAEKSEIVVQINKEKALQDAGKIMQLELPQMTSGFGGWHISYLSSQRDGDFVLPFPISESYKYTITLPEGYELVTLKQRVDLKNEAGSVKIELSPKGNQITVSRSLRLDKSVIAPADYPALRALINEWLDTNYTTLLLRKAVD
ncbi:MAG TPA: DUF3857 domain-containing protein [Bacteroidales bacterium]|nr:DUF3857 domain-containing protein [Bacteroidales bacterium]